MRQFLPLGGRYWPAGVVNASRPKPKFISAIRRIEEPDPSGCLLAVTDPNQNSAQARISMVQGTPESHLWSEKHPRHLSGCLKRWLIILMRRPLYISVYLKILTSLFCVQPIPVLALNGDH